MAKALVAIADGSEDIETVTIIDTLRRGGVEVTVASVMDSLQVTCANGTRIVADVNVTECADQAWDAVIVPGGMPGSEHIAANETFTALLKKQQENDGVIAAICAAPAVVLAKHDLLKGKQATCYPGFEAELLESAGFCMTQDVIVDGQVITSRGPATALRFALVLVGKLVDPEMARKVGQGMLANI